MNESMSSEEEVLTDVSCEISNYDNNGEVLPLKSSSLEDQPKGDQLKQDRPKEDQSNEDRPKKDQSNKDQPKVAQPKVDQLKEDQPKVDQSKEDQPKMDQSKVNQSKEDQPKEDQSNEDRPKKDQSNKDQPKVAQSKVDQPKEDQPKMDQSKVNQSKEDQPKEDQSKEDQSKDDQPKEEWLDIIGNGQLMKKVIKKGTKDVKPIRHDTCIIKFIGVLDDGTVVEDHDNVSIHLGDFDVVQGLDLTIALMELGEIAEIKIDPRFAYGTRGEGSIPPDATITYTIELKAIEDSPDIESLSVNERKELGNKKRQRGNWWFVRKELNFSIQCYQRALSYLQIDGMNWNENKESGPITDSQLQGLLDDYIKVCNNLAAAFIEIGSYNTALENVDKVLKYQPKNLKALFRKGRILKAKGELGKAYMIFLEVQKTDPDMKSLQTELMILKERISKQTEKEKYLYAKMLGINKETDKSSKNIKVEEKSKIAKGILWTVIGASAAVIGILVHRFVS
ncbi:Peptidyl-prolyl cis-trans isomerase FKBP8 [Trachymyrmex zeteki]|uniref:peptidylprolyl isomerase n=2 Tax=Mycetomoellerius zeteki TaxID=64791 RepID=A0A151WLH5_9HYME|nr:Peptidyl-prolyl cis-trans isomerase FKBP8 [Trachymyrmex zeteki]